jgi:integrase
MELIKRPASGILTVEINTPQGKRRVSTGCTDPKQAREVVKAANIESIEVLAKAGQITQELIRKLTIGGNMTVEQAIEDWEKWLREVVNSDRTAENHVMFVRAWARETKVLQQKLCAVTEGQIGRWINADDGVKLASRRSRLAAVRSLFRFCSIRQYLNPDPSREVRIKTKLLTHDQKEPKKKTCFTDKQIQKLLDHLTLRIAELMGHELTPAVEKKINAAKFWYCAVLIGRYTGLRLGDIASLEKASLREPGKIIVWTDKRDTRIELPLHEQVVKALAYIPQSRTAHCFPEQDATARNAKQRSILSVQFSRLLEACGIEGHSYHDLRSTLATELHVNENSLEEIAKALGHRSTRVTKGYIREVDKD